MYTTDIVYGNPRGLGNPQQTVSTDGAVSLQQLEYKRPEYVYFLSTWETIADLKEGAVAMLRNVQKYCPQRVDEDEDLYNARLAKFAYTPVMSNAIREFTSKLAGAPLHLSGIDDQDFWQTFRDNTNGQRQSQRRNENELINQLFSSLLYYGRVYVAVDTPAQAVTPRSEYEASLYGLLPYVLVYEPQHVPNWGNDWFLTKQFYTDAQPLQMPRTMCRWCVWTPESVKVYESEVMTHATSNWVIERVNVAGQWIMANNGQVTVPLVSEWNHGLGRCPMTTLTLPTELWTGNSVYTKQLQHTLIESGWTEAGSVAGTIQRIFTPQPPPQMDDPRFTYEQPDYSELSQVGNNHVLIGADYRFVESSGVAIKATSDQLAIIESQIKDLVSMQFASVPPDKSGANQQSGAAKQVDQTMLQDAMKSYGSKVVSLYKDILSIVAELVGKAAPTASGLDSYSTDNLGDMVDQSTKLAGLPIPATATKIWYGKLANLMVGSISPEDEEAIQHELEQAHQSGQFDAQSLQQMGQSDTLARVDKAGQPSCNGDMQKLKKHFGLSDADAAYVLNGAGSKPTKGKKK